MKKYLALLVITLLSLQNAPSVAAQNESAAFDQSHTIYADVLGEYVKEGSVDYGSLKSNPEKLDSYLTQTSGVTRKEFDKWSKEEQLAFLINLYNAATLKLVSENYPVNSIKDIAKDSGGPWEQPIVELFGDNITFNALEHEVIRKNYPEPRIHFALVCAAQSCPVLLDNPYLGSNLKNQLETQTRIFLSDSSINSVDSNVGIIYLSKIFEWFPEDFIQESGSVIGFVNPYLGDKAYPEYKIEYTNYDWSLNDNK